MDKLLKRTKFETWFKLREAGTDTSDVALFSRPVGIGSCSSAEDKDKDDKKEKKKKEKKDEED